MLNFVQVPSNIRREANRIARLAGYGKATGVILGSRDAIVARVRPGYRKITTDEYVSNSYRQKFGWKNTYYQHAKTVVMVRSREAAPVIALTAWWADGRPTLGL